MRGPTADLVRVGEAVTAEGSGFTHQPISANIGPDTRPCEPRLHYESHKSVQPLSAKRAKWSTLPASTTPRQCRHIPFDLDAETGGHNILIYGIVRPFVRPALRVAEIFKAEEIYSVVEQSNVTARGIQLRRVRGVYSLNEVSAHGSNPPLRLRATQVATMGSANPLTYP